MVDPLKAGLLTKGLYKCPFCYRLVPPTSMLEHWKVDHTRYELRQKKLAEIDKDLLKEMGISYTP